MGEESTALFSEVRDLIEAGRLEEAAAQLAEFHAADAAEAFAELDRDERTSLIPALPLPVLSGILEYLPDDERRETVEEIPQADLAPVLDEIDDDIVADILHEMPLDEANNVLASMKNAAAVMPLLRHPDETAGGHMTLAYISLGRDWTAEQAITHLRRLRPDAEFAYYLYVVDDAGKLEGVVSLRDLIIAQPSTRMSDIMARDVVMARDDMDQEEVARLVQRYDLLALPVVDAERRLIGVITVDDVLDVVEEEATEDILKLAGVGVKETALAPLRDSARRRLPWLGVNMVVALMAAIVVSQFEATIERIAALAVFMPIIAGQGGNAGIQTSTIIVRGLGLDEINFGDLARVLVKELGLGLVKGVVFGGALLIIVYVWRENTTLALVAGSAMFLNMIVASIGGVMIPMTLRYGLKVDPATAAGVFDTMLTDIMGFFIFLGLATLFIDRIA